MEKVPLQEIIELSGLPGDQALSFLVEEFHERGLSVETASLDDLKSVLVDMLQNLILEESTLTLTSN